MLKQLFETLINSSRTTNNHNVVNKNLNDHENYKDISHLMYDGLTLQRRAGYCSDR